ncbi:hypothetical protein APX70_00037 [Pseudomonas syringae pv. maculicola]|uniref:Uncharacterized protein n=1 Tax=Pseudomonas syringae pv. maculicola TaxID=59511 RepID=A0A3M3B8Z9_PSEYM|nr:hypothetical protein APX70_00037 [Pseudomonas syringae pv. maculicola]
MEWPFNKCFKAQGDDDVSQMRAVARKASTSTQLSELTEQLAGT